MRRDNFPIVRTDGRRLNKSSPETISATGSGRGRGSWRRPRSQGRKLTRRVRCGCWLDSRRAADPRRRAHHCQRFSEIWGQQVIVENKPGAGGHLAIEVAAHANHDGYTMVWVGGSIPLYGLMIKSINYDPEADLTPVTLVGTYPNILAVPNSSPWQSVRDLIGAAKANPGIITFSSPGVGTSPHLTGVLFARMAGIEFDMCLTVAEDRH